jgi:hypothetical protein
MGGAEEYAMTIKAIRPDAASGAGLDRGDARPIGRNARIPLGGVQIVAGIVLIGMVALGLTGYVEKWLWMRQLDFVAIFWTLLSVQCAMGLAAFVFAFAFLWLNLRRSVRSVAAAGSAAEPWRPALVSVDEAQLAAEIAVFPKILRIGFAFVSFVVAVLFGIAMSSQWDSFLRFRYGKTFGVSDPLYGVDVGFYVFHLPFYEMLQRSLLVLTLVTLAIVAANYLLAGMPARRGAPETAANRKAAAHVAALLLVLVADLGWGFYLGHYQLLYSTTGVVYGAGYTAVHVTRWALWGMVGLSAAACALCALNVYRPRIGQLGLAGAVYVAAWFLGVGLAPALFQKFVVQPSELTLEKPYLTNYIQSTRDAYQLSAIKETSYPALADLTPAVIERNEDTIQNIRLWDARPLLQTYQQTQAIRLYYDFYNVATDRYRLPDGYHQVMLSARELSAELPAAAQTWVNQYLQFTHGYGVVMNFVSKTVGGGFPRYTVENVPAQSDFGLKIAQPAVYYGESMPGYRIVDTEIKEFDYPKGNDNVYTSYAGTGGIPLDSLWRKLLFAWNKADVNILLTSYLKPESRIQIHRDVRERVAQIAPFLRLDADPYPVLSEGKLYWIQDAYTGSSYFPYSNPQATARDAAQSQPNAAQGIDTVGPQYSDPSATSVLDGLNYVRNSVKVVVDMYDGDVRFYVMDPADPVLGAYRRAFPGMFRALGELAPDLKAHLRYPEDIFAVQANQYRTFHMTDPQVFYNREDLWAAPLETYAGATQPMQPYYILAKLPGSQQLEYMLMTPFTPHNRDNMISWMAARSDFPDYGQMIFYALPKEKLIYGPNQIEAMINQNTMISQQLTLWNQNGSRVVRGKQIVTPIENSFLYVVPLYLKAEGANFPQLKRVIAVAGDRVVMEPTLDEALTALFGAHGPRTAEAGARPATAAATSIGPSDNSEARARFQDAQSAMEHGEWAKFGDAMEKLKLLLANPPAI